MTTTLTTRTATIRSATDHVIVDAQLRIGDVKDDVRKVWAVVSQLDSRDAVWRLVGPLLTEIADQLRLATGAVVPRSVAPDLPPVVRQRDLAVAARRLLRGDVEIVDRAAAIEVRALCTRLSAALA